MQRDASHASKTELSSTYSDFHHEKPGLDAIVETLAAKTTQSFSKKRPCPYARWISGGWVLQQADHGDGYHVGT